MPELPEVETSRRRVDKLFKGKRIVEVIPDPDDRIVYDQASPEDFREAVEGARVIGTVSTEAKAQKAREAGADDMILCKLAQARQNFCWQFNSKRGSDGPRRRDLDSSGRADSLPRWYVRINENPQAASER